ncbi:DUF418 domain-containing protein [Flagellimonas flava]|uniref:DUF418 domain-containing protein n=1 Tax=Flagellimonas flava TaxID=570519 RepID=UPI003D646B19
MKTVSTLAPVSNKERFVILDIVRGFALYGVLMANLVWFFSGYGDLDESARASLPWSNLDSFSLQWETFFVVNKFVTIFSLLFGIGFAIQLQRIAGKGKKFHLFYLKRMLWLLVFGVLHLTFLLYTDILHLYAILGIFLLFWTSLTKKQLIYTGLFFTIIAPVLVHLLMWTLPTFLGTAYDLEIVFANQWDVAAQRHSAFQNGTYLQIIQANLADVWAWLTTDDALTTGLGSFGLFLLGYAIGKSGILARIQGGLSQEEVGRFIKVMILAFLLGVGCQGILELDLEWLANGKVHVRVIRELLWRTGVFFLALSYCIGLVLLFNRNPKSRLLHLFAPVGKMALTNYLVQSVFGFLIFYGIGLGFYGKMGPTLCIVLTTLIFIVQICYSKWWLNRFRFGPAEWLWRSLTYGKLDSNRLLKNNPSTI